MSIQYCAATNRYIDTDENPEYFCRECGVEPAIDQDDFNGELCEDCLVEAYRAEAADNAFKGGQE